jgi:hypothetical protein
VREVAEDDWSIVMTIEIQSHPEKKGWGYSGSTITQFVYGEFCVRIVGCVNNSYVSEIGRNPNEHLFLVEIGASCLPYLLKAIVYDGDKAGLYFCLSNWCRTQKDILSRLWRNETTPADQSTVKVLFNNVVDKVFDLMSPEQKILMISEFYRQGIKQGAQDKALEIREALRVL